MHIDLMRRIDRWLGVPLAGLLTGLDRVGRRLGFGRAAKRGGGPGAIKRILFIELSEMGSAIIVDPALRLAAQRHPGAEHYFLIFAQNRGSLDILGTIARDHVLTIRATNLPLFVFDTLGMIWRLRRLSFDVAIDLELFSRFTSILSLLSGAPVRVGFHRFHNEGLYRGNHLTHPVLYNPHQHMAKNFLAMIYALDEDRAVLPHAKRRIADEEIALAPYAADPGALESFRDRLIHRFPQLDAHRRWIILNPNASNLMPLRKWPLASFAELAKRLLEDPAVAVLVTGAADERPDASHILDHVASPRAIDLTGFTTLAELPLLYLLADLMVTNDSGPAHFAAATRLKTIVLFGPETPALYGALNPNAEFVFKGLSCSPCVSAANHRRSPCTDNQCMQQITVAEVFERTRSEPPFPRPAVAR